MKGIVFIVIGPVSVSIELVVCLICATWLFYIQYTLLHDLAFAALSNICVLEHLSASLLLLKNRMWITQKYPALFFNQKTVSFGYTCSLSNEVSDFLCDELYELSSIKYKL